MKECQSNLNPFLVKSSLASFISYKTENQQDWLKKSYKDATTKERTWKPRENKFSCENFLYLLIPQVAQAHYESPEQHYPT